MTEVPGAPVICCAGPPGSGKSVVGAALASLLGWALVDQDSATNPLMEQVAIAAGVPFDLDAPRLQGPVREARYACLTAIGRDNARLGVPTILVAPFTAELNDPAAMRRLAEAIAPGVLHTVLVDTTEETRAARTAARGAERDHTPRPARRSAPERDWGEDTTWPAGVLVVPGQDEPEAIALRIITALSLGDARPANHRAAAERGSQ